MTATHLTQRCKDGIETASAGASIFIDDKAPLTVQNNTDEGIHATRNGYDYIIQIEGRDCTVELMDTGRVDESKEIEVESISVLA